MKALLCAVAAAACASVAASCHYVGPAERQARWDAEKRQSQIDRNRRDGLRPYECLSETKLELDSFNGNLEVSSARWHEFYSFVNSKPAVDHAGEHKVELELDSFVPLSQSGREPAVTLLATAPGSGVQSVSVYGGGDLRRLSSDSYSRRSGGHVVRGIYVPGARTTTGWGRFEVPLAELDRWSREGVVLRVRAPADWDIDVPREWAAAFLQRLGEGTAQQQAWVRPSR